MGMDNNDTIETNMILTDDIEISKLIYEYVVREQYIGMTRYE